MKVETLSLSDDVHQPIGGRQPRELDGSHREGRSEPAVGQLVDSPAGGRTALGGLIRWIAACLAAAAVLSSAVRLMVTPLLTNSMGFIRVRLPRPPAPISGTTLSAIPLILAGAAYILLQTLLRPCGIELVKRLMLGSAFLLWGVVQMMPLGSLATELGSLVIALYVLDLALIIRGELLKS